MCKDPPLIPCFRETPPITFTGISKADASRRAGGCGGGRLPAAMEKAEARYETNPQN